MFIKIDPQLRQSLQTFIHGRRANLRSWREFAFVQRFRAPSSLRQAKLRMQYNLYYFSSNYLLVIVGLFCFTILRKPFLLFALAFAFVGSFMVWQNAAKPPPVIAGRPITSHEQAYILVCVCMPLLYMASAGSVAFWLLTICGILTLAHAYAMDTPHAIDDEEELSKEIRTHWGERGELLLSYIDRSASALTAAQQLLSQGAQSVTVNGPNADDNVKSVLQDFSLERIKASRASGINGADAASVSGAAMADNTSCVIDMQSASESVTVGDADAEYHRRQLLGNHYWAEPPTVQIDEVLPQAQQHTTDTTAFKTETELDQALSPHSPPTTNPSLTEQTADELC